MCYKTHTNTYKVHMNKTRDERGKIDEPRPAGVFGPWPFVCVCVYVCVCFCVRLVFWFSYDWAFYGLALCPGFLWVRCAGRGGVGYPPPTRMAPSHRGALFCFTGFLCVRFGTGFMCLSYAGFFMCSLMTFAYVFASVWV